MCLQRLVVCLMRAHALMSVLIKLSALFAFVWIFRKDEMLIH